MVCINKNETLIYDELADEYFQDEFGNECEYDWTLADEDFDNIFDKDTGEEYVICGTIGLWDGERRGHSTKIYHSLKEAILACNDGFNGYIRVTEGAYGKLLVAIAHHDGNNCLEIRELTNLGHDMWDNYKEVEDILNRKGATRNVKFIKRYC